VCLHDFASATVCRITDIGTREAVRRGAIATGEMHRREICGLQGGARPNTIFLSVKTLMPETDLPVDIVAEDLIAVGEQG
jgi:hypothetical protein